MSTDQLTHQPTAWWLSCLIRRKFICPHELQIGVKRSFCNAWKLPKEEEPWVRRVSQWCGTNEADQGEEGDTLFVKSIGSSSANVKHGETR